MAKTAKDKRKDFLLKKLVKLLKRAEDLRVASQFHHREMAEALTTHARLMAHISDQKSEELDWFTELNPKKLKQSVPDHVLYAASWKPMPYFYSSVIAREKDDHRVMKDPRTGRERVDVREASTNLAEAFSHLKSVEQTKMANWVMPTEGLLLGFLLTDLKGIKGSDIHMPLQSFIIELPFGVAFTVDLTDSDSHNLMRDVPYNRIYKDKETTALERIHPLHYLIVTEGYNPNIGKSLLVYSYSGATPSSSTVFDGHSSYFTVDISDPTESLDSVLKTFEEVRAEERTEFKGGTYYEDTYGLIFDEVLSGGVLRDRLLRIVVNTILYMNSNSAVVEHAHAQEIEEIKKRKRGRKLSPASQQTIKELENDPYYILGTDITITKADIDAYQQQNVPARTGTGRKLTRPSITRGHWRRQPYGDGRKKRRLKWIKPYIRGKELGDLPVVSHRYSLTSSPT
jgi:hypothetical protein